MKDAIRNNLKFLSGGGEMGEHTRSYNWSQSPLGPAEMWPYCLRNAVSNMLRSGFPMLVLWGKEFICFHNDAFLPSLGAEQRPALGKKAQEIWHDGWDFIGTQLTTVLTTGRAVTFEHQPVVITRDGYTADVYWTFCYSLILDDDGEPGGVLVTCLETTSLVTAEKEIAGREKAIHEARQKRVYETVIGATPDLVYVFDLEYHFTYANTALLAMWGKSWDNAVGKGLRDNGYEEWHAAMHEREIDQVAATGKSVRGEVSFPHAQLGTRVYDYILVPVFNHQGQVEAVAGTTRDISDIKQIEIQLRESEDRFRSLILQAPVAIAVFRGEDLIADIANDEYLKLIDKTELEFINLPLFKSLPLVRPVVEPLVRQVMQTGELYIGNEVEVALHRHGSIQTGFFNLTYSPLYAKNGHIDGFMVIASEVTTQVIARRKIEESEGRLREKEAALANAIELAELGTWRLDAKSNQIFVSQRYAEMFGLTKLSISLDSALSMVAESDREQVRDEFDAAMRKGSPGRFDAEYQVINVTTGNTHIIHALGQAFVDEAGALTRIEGTAQDVTAQREIQLALENKVQVRTEELQATNEELAATNEELSESAQLLMRSNEELSQFAYVASHDLQEPVRKISVFVEMLEKSLTHLDERSKKYLEKIDDSANRMLTLIRDVLTHSQISNNASKFVKVHLGKVLANTLIEFEVLIQERGCKIKSDELPVIDAIEIQMSQLFNNLISNAMKFSSSDKPLHIEIRCEKLSATQKHLLHLASKKEYYRISFIDNGIGFDQSHAVQIFEIFQRLHTKDKYTGTGIGLATCKKIVQNHGGQISAISAPGKGATFEIVLPSLQ